LPNQNFFFVSVSEKYIKGIAGLPEKQRIERLATAGVSQAR
jgi:hypothetical protein